MDKAEAKAVLRAHDLRVTASRVALILRLADEDRPLSCSEVVEALDDSDVDPATVYRNLVRLTELGVTRIVSHASGRARYELVDTSTTESHDHPHFACSDCGTVSCMPETDRPRILGGSTRWQQALAQAVVQFQGSCPDCIESVAAP